MLAATAQRSNARLATVNHRHFPMLDDLIVPY
jgi:predicted nucleic acid-binding protein